MRAGRTTWKRSPEAWRGEESVSARHEILMRFYRALGAGDAAALEEIVAADFRGHVTPGLPAGIGGDHEGLPAMRERVWWQLGRLFVIVAEPHEILDLAARDAVARRLSGS